MSSADFRFLKYLANNAGVPHFYDILKKFNQEPSIDIFDLNTFSSLFYESTLHTDEYSMLHRYQKKVLNEFQENKLNRYFISASTSFGKTYIAFEVIKKMKYSNVVLIFPTIALLTENMERILTDESFMLIRENYKIHTLSEVIDFAEKNIFIYTPERFISFVEKTGNTYEFDFAFVDEIYKIDNDYLIDEELKENERDVAYRLAVFYSLKKDADVLLSGPYMEFSNPIDSDYNNSLDNFFNENRISLINYNDYEIVNKSFYEVKRLRIFPENSNLKIEYRSNTKKEKLIDTVNTLIKIPQNVIVYCANRGSHGGVEHYAKVLIESGILRNHDYSKYEDIVRHISSNFKSNWILVRALRHGIGIHHGLIPKYIQKEIINLFNTGLLKVLISTTTITEGVNTSAKNLVVMHSKKGIKTLKKFDARNIAGRAGRFGYHYSGTVIDLSNDFMKVINGHAEILKHKNYDLNAPKDEIDLYYSNNKYLSRWDRDRKEKISQAQKERGIPDEILDQYKVVSRSDKIKVYDAIMELDRYEIQQIGKLIRTINSILRIDYDGFQIIENIVASIIKNNKLKFFIAYKGKSGNYSIFTSLVQYYLEDGFNGSIRYHLKNNESIDEAVSKTSDFVYNTLKYQAVKYFGVFNLMYKYFISKAENKKFEEVSGIDKLLVKFEYNAFTDEGRIASDYGVPSKVVDYYELANRQTEIKSGFDTYELKMFNKIDRIISEYK